MLETFYCWKCASPVDEICSTYGPYWGINVRWQGLNIFSQIELFLCLYDTKGIFSGGICPIPFGDTADSISPLVGENSYQLSPVLWSFTSLLTTLSLLFLPFCISFSCILFRFLHTNSLFSQFPLHLFSSSLLLSFHNIATNN